MGKDLVEKFRFTLLPTDILSYIFIICDHTIFIIADEGSQILKLTFALLAALVIL